MTDSGSPRMSARLPEPESTSLSHAVRWIASGVPVQSLAFQEATGDRPYVMDRSYSAARQQLLSALHDGRVPAKALLCLRHKSVMYEIELDDWLSRTENGGAPWFLFLDALNEKTRCLSAQRYESDALIDIPSTLWEERYVRWNAEQLVAWLGDYDACLGPVQLSVKKLYQAFVPAKEQPRLEPPALSNFNTKEKESLLKLVVGMAIGGYGYNPRAERSNVAKEIVDDLTRAGITMNADTVRKYLRLGAEMLPPHSSLSSNGSGDGHDVRQYGCPGFLAKRPA